MADLNSILIAVIVISIYSIIVFILWKYKWLEKHNFTPWAGPILMWKTTRGREFLDKLAKQRRFWKWYANICIVISLVSMVFITALLVWSVSKVTLIPKDKAPTPEMLLGIPGINPFIPVFYGIIALVIAIVFHELSHGVLSRVANLHVKSMGLLLFIFPIGAFVEPDEEQLLKTTRIKRARVVAAGPGTNIIIAFIALAVFSLLLAPAIEPNAEGVGILGVDEKTPASRTTLQPYDILITLNHTPVRNYEEFKSALNNTKPGQTVEISFYSKNRNTVVHENITLEDRYNYTHLEEDRNKAYMGIVPFNHRGFRDLLVNPFSNGISGFLSFLSLPFLGLSPMDENFGSFYTINSPLPAPAFYIMLNIFYWIFWINLMVGLTNTLPTLPLDAGYMTRDGIEIVLQHTKMKKERREKVVKALMLLIGLLILFMILFQIIGPRIFGA